MTSSVELLAGLLDRDDAFVTCEDFDGPCSGALRDWQCRALIASAPARHPRPTCPHCGVGVPYAVGNRFLCNRCYNAVPEDVLRCWPVRPDRLLAWVAAGLGCRGGVQRIDERLWQLGTFSQGGTVRECFYHGRGPASGSGLARLRLYRQVLVLFGLTTPDPGESTGPQISLLEILRPDGSVAVPETAGTRGAVRFDGRTGALWAGDRCLGEVPLGTKEFSLLARLAQDLDLFVSYRELKQSVLHESGSRDATDEATLCQGLKSRIKRKWVPAIDRVIVTTNKGDGYRLRGRVEL